MEQKIYSILIVNSIAITIFLTLTNQIYGVDSWYWAKKLNFSVTTVNFLALIFYIIVGELVTLNSEKKILSVIFLCSLFSLRFLEFEADDYLMYFFLFTSTVVFEKISPLFSMGVFYYLYKTKPKMFFSQSTFFIEGNPNMFSFFMLVPSLYILLKNRKYVESFFVMVISALFPTPKFIASGIPLFIFPIFYSMRKEEIRYSKTIVIIFLLIYIFLSWRYVSDLCFKNIEAFNRLCNKETKMCNNTEVNDWTYGHYFAYLGYEPKKYPA